MTSVNFIELAISTANNYGFKLVTTIMGFTQEKWIKISPEQAGLETDKLREVLASAEKRI